MNNQKIAIDINGLIFMMWVKKFPTGINRVGLEYVKHYNKYAIVAFHCRGRYFFIKESSSQKLFNTILEWQKFTSRWVLLKFIIKMLLSIDFKIDYGNTCVLSIAHSSFNLRRKFMALKIIYLVHDLISVDYPEYGKLAANNKYILNERNLKSVASFTRVFLCNSKSTESRLKKFAILNNIELPRSNVALLGTRFTTYNNTQLPRLHSNYVSRPYFVILSTIEARKNHIMLLNIWRCFAETIENQDDIPNLIIIGKRGWRCKNVFNMIEDCKKIKNHVYELNNANDIEIQSYLKSAQALLFPSFAEGFGLPLIEALNCGTTAIVSDIPPFREFGGDIPEYIDPLDTISWMNIILEYAKPQSNLRNKQLQRLVGYQAPTWEKHFELVDVIIGELYEK